MLVNEADIIVGATKVDFFFQFNFIFKYSPFRHTFFPAYDRMTSGVKTPDVYLIFFASDCQTES